jgi:hypothetical protein
MGRSRQSPGKQEKKLKEGGKEALFPAGCAQAGGREGGGSPRPHRSPAGKPLRSVPLRSRRPGECGTVDLCRRRPGGTWGGTWGGRGPARPRPPPELCAPATWSSPRATVLSGWGRVWGGRVSVAPSVRTDDSGGRGAVDAQCPPGALSAGHRLQ